MRGPGLALLARLPIRLARLEAQGTGVIHGAVTDQSRLGVGSASVAATLVDAGEARVIQFAIKVLF